MQGMELRVMRLHMGGMVEPANAVVVRIDPAYFTFRVRYDPFLAATVQGWQERDGDIFVVNGGFFEENNAPVGLVVTDGELFGDSFEQYDDPFHEFGGMFTVVGDEITIRRCAEQPYQEDERLDQAVQGWPVLVHTGEPVDFDHTGETARRTAIALDQTGRVIFVVVDSTPISFFDLRDWLAMTDELAIASALNLDGGPSAGLVLATGSWLVQYDSPGFVPGVIVAVPRE
jgi:uncharacterized protein YigE (DUF2233 family)